MSTVSSSFIHIPTITQNIFMLNFLFGVMLSRASICNFHRETENMWVAPAFSRRSTKFQSYGLSQKGRPIEDLDEVVIRVASC